MNRERMCLALRAVALASLGSLLCCFSVGRAEEDTAKPPAHFNESFPLEIYRGSGVDIHRPYDQPGIDGIRSTTTGYFYVKQIDGTWWLLDPNGRGYWHAGMLGMKFGKFGFGRGPEEAVSGRKTIFATPQKYVEYCARALDAGGFNGTSAWASDPLAGPKAYIRQLNQRGFHRWQETGNLAYKLTEGPGWHDVSNPFHPAFPAWCDREAELLCAPFRDSPWLIGYQLANELNWFGSELASMVMRYPADHHAKIELAELAKQHFDSVRRFNQAWGTNHKAFADIVNSATAPDLPPTREAEDFAWAYAEHALDVFLNHWAGAVRRHDPNHLILGLRQHGHQTPGLFSRGWWTTMGKYCDVISINAYAASSQVDPARGVPSTMSTHFTELSEVTGRPLLNSEWYPNVAEVPIFRRYQSFMIAHPAFVGSQFFNWAGHKELSYTVRADDGRSTYQPKPELEAVAAEVHAEIGLLRTEGKPEQFTFQPQAARQWNRPLPPRMTAEGQFPVTIGGLTFEHRSDGYHVRWNGELFQDFRPMLHQRLGGQNRYIRGLQHPIVAWYEDDEFLVIDSILKHPGTRLQDAPADLQMPNARQEPIIYACQFSIRLWIPKQENGVFVTQLLSVENRSQASWLCNWVAQACETRLGSTGQDDLPINVRSLHLGGGWTDPELDLGYFSLAPDQRTDGKFQIFKHNGRRAPGRQEKMQVMLVGAQSWSPDAPATVVHLAWVPSSGVGSLQTRCQQLVDHWFTKPQPAQFVSRMVE